MQRLAINNGLILGGVLIFCSLVFYFLSVEMFLMYKSFVLFIFVVFMFVKTANDLRNSQGGFMSFGQGLGAIMTTALVGFALCTSFEYVLYNLIDPTIVDQMVDMSIEKMDEMSQFLDDEQLENITEELESKDYASPIAMFTNYLIRLVFPGFVVGSIVAAIRKNEKKDFA